MLARLPRQLWHYARLAPITWFDHDRLAACRYPRNEAAFAALASRGVRLVINLHERGHATAQLERFGFHELHLPVRDFTPPPQAVLRQGVDAIQHALESDQCVAVHCGAGLGRTGTLIACYLVRGGMSADVAIAHVRAMRPGSIETVEQEQAIRTFATGLESTRAAAEVP